MIKMCRLLAILLVTITALEAADMQDTKVVQLEDGGVRGIKVKTHYGVPYYSFRGIPYAKPPVGSLRFKPPEPVKPWKGIRDAIELAPVAPQFGLFTNLKYAGDEDCLYINVFTSQIPKDKTSSLKPVLVYIHGGGYYIGSGNNEMHGPGRIMNTSELVLVTMNYRLGPLGFLSTGDSVIPGNMGLKDQALALKWVQKNIAHFGGDPGNVIIGGISAGGSSTSLHMFSPMSKGLFHKAIAESGSALAPWSAKDQKYARNLAFRFGETLGFKTNSSEELLAFLTRIPAKELIEASSAVATEDEKHPLPALFLPVVENENKETTFMPEQPLDLIRKGQYNTVPLISGVASQEGLLIGMDYVVDSSWYDKLNDNLEPVLNVHLGLEKGSERAREITRKVREFYFGDKPISKDTLTQLVQLYGDIMFYIWADRAAKEHVKVSKDPLYYFVFSFEGDFNYKSALTSVEGASHGAELGYLFESMFSNPAYLDKETETMKMSDKMIKMWINFAKTGNPTPVEDPLLGETWKQFTKSESNYLDINTPFTIKKDLFKDRMDFWNTIFPENK